jgi:hypothetical protein
VNSKLYFLKWKVETPVTHMETKFVLVCGERYRCTIPLPQ